jgi:hypothetical protein
MSVDYYTCSHCRCNFPDVSRDATWCDCGGCFCSPICANQEDEGGNDGATCCICRLEVIKDEDLLNFLLGHFKIMREQAIELYRIHYGE